MTDYDELLPEEPNETRPMHAGAREVIRVLTREKAFVYVGSCDCCGHTFLCLAYPMEVVVDAMGRTLEVYGINTALPFGQMIIPERPGQRGAYVRHFLHAVPEAWGYALRNKETYTVDYKKTPGHNGPRLYLADTFLFSAS